MRCLFSQPPVGRALAVALSGNHGDERCGQNRENARTCPLRQYSLSIAAAVLLRGA